MLFETRIFYNAIKFRSHVSFGMTRATLIHSIDAKSILIGQNMKKSWYIFVGSVAESESVVIGIH